MKYFCTEQERKGTCYHEFYKGKWDGKTFWREDSLLINDDNMFYYTKFGRIIKSVILDYNPYNETEVLPEHWEKIKQMAREYDDKEYELVMEIDIWMQNTFAKKGIVTILGL